MGAGRGDPGENVVGATASEHSTRVLVPYAASGWRYDVVAHGAGAGFEAAAFDDSAWAKGKAAFETPDSWCPLITKVRTEWATDTDILLRRTLNVSSLSTLTISVAIDNDVDLYLDGNRVGTQVHANCAERGSLIVKLVNVAAGGHLLALRGIDRGGISYIAARVTAERQDGYVPQPGAQVKSPDSVGESIRVRRSRGRRRRG